MFNSKFFGRFFVGVSFGTVFIMLSQWADASEARKGTTVKCSIVYINGDAVIRCPKPPRVVYPAGQPQVVESGSALARNNQPSRMCKRIKLANGRPGETVTVCPAGVL